MFNLDLRIAEWRRQMLAAGIRSSEALDELEAHLRAEVEQQKSSGRSDVEAFDIAVQRIGKAGALKNEFKKIGGTPAVLEKLMIGVAGIFVGFIVFLGTVAVFMCYGSTGDRLMAAAAMICTILVACSWRFAVPFLPMIKNTWKRLVAGLACILFGFGATSFYCNVILPHFEAGPDRQLPAIGCWAVFIVAVFSCAGVGLTLSNRDREKLGINKSPLKPSEPANS
jgi:hypothetical protein